MDSNVGLAIQSVGILLLTLLSLFMRGSIHTVSLRYWTAAWTSLAIALVTLFVGFQVTGSHAVFYSVYFLGEYLFGLLFIAGCKNHSSHTRLRNIHLVALAPTFVLALVLPHLSTDFNNLLMIHSLILATLFVCALGIEEGTAIGKVQSRDSRHVDSPAVTRAGLPSLRSDIWRAQGIVCLSYLKMRPAAVWQR